MSSNKERGMDKNFPNYHSLEFAALGTEIELRIVVSDETEMERAKKDCIEAQKMYATFAGIFSRFDCQSELSILNANLNQYKKASNEIIEIAGHCLKFNNDTSGIFDPRIIETLEAAGYNCDFKKGEFALSQQRKKNDKTADLCNDLKIEGNEILFRVRMDFSGIAKGFITDKISHFLKAKGWKNFFVDSGGDMYFSGKDQNGESWRIDVEGVSHEKMMLELCEKGIATSGISRRKWEIDGEKFHHLINPQNPNQFLFDLKTVSVIADDAETADVWAKTLFLMGKEKGIIFAKEKLLPAVFLDYNGSAWISPEIKKFTY